MGAPPTVRCAARHGRHETPIATAPALLYVRSAARRDVVTNHQREAEMNRLFKAAVAGLVLAGGVLIGSTADAATPVSGPTQLWASLGAGGGNGFKVVFTGAIGDSGVSYGATANGKKTSK